MNNAVVLFKRTGLHILHIIYYIYYIYEQCCCFVQTHRFCSQEFTLDKFDVEVHLSNNSIQKHFQNGARSSKLPESNMWSSDDFKLHLHSIGEFFHQSSDNFKLHLHSIGEFFSSVE